VARSKVRVRAAVPSDLDVLIRFTEEAVEREGLRSRGSGRHLRGKELRARCARLLADPAHRVVVATDDRTDEVLGAAIFGFDPATVLTEIASVYVSYLLVAPQHRRRGAGRALVAAAAGYAEELGVDHVVVGVTTPGREANRFFARLGFAPLVIRRIVPVATLRRALASADPAAEGRAHGVRQNVRRRSALGLARTLPRPLPRVRRTG
jgi:GNAT superfamily N-acetyltransferase